MTTPPPPQPRLRSIALGILIGVALVIILCSASSVLKWIGAPFLILPRLVGIIEPVHGNEIVTVPMGSPPTGVTFPRAETYAVYLSDLSLLETTNLLVEAGAQPWLVVHRADTGEAIPVTFVERGLIPFDEPRAMGRPVMRFEIPGAGTYLMVHPRRGFSFQLVPDTVTGKEGILTLAAIVQLVLLSLPLLIVSYRPWVARRRRWQAHQLERRKASDEVMRRRTRR